MIAKAYDRFDASQNERNDIDVFHTSTVGEHHGGGGGRTHGARRLPAEYNLKVGDRSDKQRDQ